MDNANLKEFRKRMRSALGGYFNADGDPQGRSDMEAVLDIINSYLPILDGKNTQQSGGDGYVDANIGIVDAEGGLNVAYDFSSHFDSGMLDAMDPLVRIELLEACIYALNTRINELETEFKKRINERRKDE